MSRRSRRVPVHLDASGVDTLSEADLKAVLRGADNLIGQGGRTLLMRILRGSRNKDVLERGLNESPVYGYFKNLSDEKTLARIDWTILNGYLQIEYSHRLPLLVYTDKGWEIERENYADELLEGIEQQLENGPPFEMQYLKDRDRGMILLLLLDKIEATQDRKFIPALKAWQKVDYKKVRIRIGQAIHALEAARDQSRART
jgi:superfamily II DNA helicase RecQ